LDSPGRCPGSVKDKTVVRAGYGIGYERLPIYLTHNNSGLEPGLSETDTLVLPTSLTVANLVLPVQPAGAPLSLIPAVGTGSRTQNLYVFDQNLRTPVRSELQFSRFSARFPAEFHHRELCGEQGL